MLLLLAEDMTFVVYLRLPSSYEVGKTRVYHLPNRTTWRTCPFGRVPCNLVFPTISELRSTGWKVDVRVVGTPGARGRRAGKSVRTAAMLRREISAMVLVESSGFGSRACWLLR